MQMSVPDNPDARLKDAAFCSALRNSEQRANLDSMIDHAQRDADYLKGENRRLVHVVGRQLSGSYRYLLSGCGSCMGKALGNFCR
jgi:hypothetical protein